MTKFSKRLGHEIIEKEITIREEAPIRLREFIVQLIYQLGYEPSFIRSVICQVLKIQPDRNNWSEYPNIDGEVNQLIQECEWYYVYDIIEALFEKVDKKFIDTFQSELNDYFKANGIGWKLENGQIETRGNILFEIAVTKVTNVLAIANLQTARSEMEEAIHDLSRRPKPDITGAIQHSLTCLECVCREITGNKKSTLGELMKKATGIIPPPLDIAIEKIWGFASQQGRHLNEGGAPDYLEAELVVELTAAISTYLGKKLGGAGHPPEEITNKIITGDLPF